MDASQRGVRFQGYPLDSNEDDGEVTRNGTPVPIPRSISNSNPALHPPASPRPRTTLPQSQQQQQQPQQQQTQQPQQQNPRPSAQSYFPMELPIDYGIPSIVEEGGFPFETPSPGAGRSGYAWSPISPNGTGQSYYPNGQFYATYDQDNTQQGLHTEQSERSPTDRNPTRPRPGVTRLPSNTYLPIRHPETGGHGQYSATSPLPKPTVFARRTTSQRAVRPGRVRRGQFQKFPEDPDDDYLQHTSAPGSYRRESEMESEDGSAGDEYREYDNEFDVDKELISAVAIDLMPSAEDLANPEYVERLEWQNRLAQVLSGDVVTSEKKRIAEPSGPEDEKAHRYELWLGIRAKAYGRSLADQRRVLIEGRAYMDRVIEDVLSFNVKTLEDGAANAQNAEKQVDDILARWDRCEALYSSRAALMEDKPATAEGSEFEITLSALVAWSNVTKNVRTLLQILRAWTGQNDLDLTRRGGPPMAANDIAALNINDESSFIERILKENRIEQTFSKEILSTLNKQVYKAKETVEVNHVIFERMRLPSFLGDVQLLVNFPTKLIEEALKIRLAYARKLRDPGLIVIEQLIDDFALCMKVAVGIKKEYLMVTEPTEGWNLVSWVDDSVCWVTIYLNVV
jgi:mitogen-activated protein kinase kinase kinase